jgi:hypothetical protein
VAKITSTDKTPQEIKAQKIRDRIQELTGITFSGELGAQLAGAVNDSILVGARKIDADKEDSPIECNAEWHFARYSGPGAAHAPLLYSISFHLAGESGNFFLSVQKLAKFLKADPDNIYAAAHLLETDGFWEVIEALPGKSKKYRPVPHKEWAEKHPNRCTKKVEFPFAADDEQLALFGRNLYAILGGEHFFPNVLRGFRKAAAGLTDEQICERAKAFMVADAGNDSGKARRKRFREFLSSDLPANHR